MDPANFNQRRSLSSSGESSEDCDFFCQDEEFLNQVIYTHLSNYHYSISPNILVSVFTEYPGQPTNNIQG